MCLDKKCGSSRYQFRYVFVSFVLLALLLMGSSKAAAQSPSADAPRRIKVAAKPEYSELAKRLKLSGLVRVEVVIAPDGKVKRAHVLGGHPVLALDAEKAAIMTEFEPSPKESTQVLEFRFGAGS